MLRILSRAAMACGLALSTLAPSSAVADPIKWRVFSYVTRMEVKPVGDAEGHVAGAWQRRGFCELSTGELAVYAASGTLDGTKGKGIAKGETTCTFEDGSKLVNAWTVDFEPGPGGLAVYKNGKGEFGPGSGRFEGIQGTFTFAGKAYTPMKDDTRGDVVMDAQGEYKRPRT
jgi:hypothetical protein